MELDSGTGKVPGCRLYCAPGSSSPNSANLAVCFLGSAGQDCSAWGRRWPKGGASLAAYAEGIVGRLFIAPHYPGLGPSGVNG